MVNSLLSERNHQYRQVDMNRGLLYEHILPESIILSLRVGVRINPYGREFEKTVRSRIIPGKKELMRYLAKPKK